MRALAEERRIQVITMTRAGMSAPQIATKLGITERTVQRIRKANGIARPAARPITPEELAAAQALLDDGASRLEAARSIGRSTSAIERAFPGRCWTRAQQNDHLGYMRLWRQLEATS